MNSFTVNKILHGTMLTLLLTGLVNIFFGCSQDNVSEIKGMVYIPSGTFLIGSDDVDDNSMGKEFGLRDRKFFENEKPLRKINLHGFYIDKFEVTNKEYKLFIDKTSHEPPPNWDDGTYPSDRGMRPVNAVSWFDANKYCQWLKKRLPVEEEWEKAARGPNGNKYPWGNVFEENKANLNKGDTVPVGSLPDDKSYYGVYDMGGNITEWTSSWYKPYPGSILCSQITTTRGGGLFSTPERWHVFVLKSFISILQPITEYRMSNKEFRIMK